MSVANSQSRDEVEGMIWRYQWDDDGAVLVCPLTFCVPGLLATGLTLSSRNRRRRKSGFSSLSAARGEKRLLMSRELRCWCVRRSHLRRGVPTAGGSGTKPKTLLNLQVAAEDDALMSVTGIELPVDPYLQRIEVLLFSLVGRERAPVVSDLIFGRALPTATALEADGR